MRRSTSTVRRACAVGTTIALVGLSTGLGIMTATSASAAEASSAAVTDGATTAPTSSSTGTSTADAPGAAASTSKTPDAATPDAETPTAPAPDVPAASGTDAPATGEPAAPTTTAPTTTPAKPSVGDAIRGAADAAKNAAQDAPVSATAAGQTAEIVGDVSYGGVLNADVDFTGGSYVWTDERGNVLSTDPYYEIGTEAAGQRVTVTVTGPDGQLATGTTEDAVPPVFLDTDGTPLFDGDETYVEAVAGERFSATFRAESTPAATYAIEYLSSDDDDTSTLPAGVSFDAATGTLSGVLTSSDAFAQFIITATAGNPSAGGSSSTLFVDVDLQAAAPAGILVAAIDASDLEDPSLDTKTWLITPDGTVSTGTLLDDQSDYTPGGRISVPQGGSLVVYGLTVDRFGNLVMPDLDEDTGDITWPRTTVTSDVASDVVEDLTEEDSPSIARVTFPHASTHTLTVSSAGVPSTSFAVEVVPTAAAAPTTPVALTPAAPVAAAAPVRQTGRLAYTGADESAPIAWALGLLVAGAGLIGARTLRRRRAQR
ncbi:putative Ig domain-containing protein [Curtobacterium caseinilyticum]|uniref:Ig domain-containing protein n=1 Tax=Curtobacterium caseinilyticum TaxID=3055137 RepID=A0ABT7TPC5_9MICO|nr:putative Ig domain-containing protein [Curtobacterium caseinilyticum]MDM7891448.1 putative Ig domain-containing protein [Curtobacterium caseinilyticum]